MSGFHLLGDNLDALIARGMLAKVAEKTLDLQYYIFKDDETAGLVLSWVIDAANRGVRVRILVDDIGLAVKDSHLAVLNTHQNIAIRIFNPFAQRGGLKTDFIFDLGRVERRMHNKTYIADSSAAIIGGRNIGNEYFSAPSGATFVDLDLLAVGPIVQDISASFDAYWNSEWVYPIEVLAQETTDSDAFNTLTKEIEADAEVFKNSPYKKAADNAEMVNMINERTFPFIWAPASFHFDPLEKLTSRPGDITATMRPEFDPIFEVIDSELIMVTPYFVPAKEGMAVLKALHEQEVQVKVVTNSLATQDVWIVHSGYAPYRKQMLNMGMGLYEMKDTAYTDVLEVHRENIEIHHLRLHVKAMIIDRRSVVIGSSNFDPRSRNYNTELVMVIHSPELAQAMLKGFEELSSPDNSYTLFLEDVAGDDGRVRQKVRWETEEEGQTVIYKDEPGASIWRKFGAWFMRAFPIEGLL